MQAFGVLDRYIGKTIFTTIMMTLFMLVSLSGIIKFVDQLKKAGQGSYDALGAGLYTLLSMPKDIQIFFPMAALLGALLGLGMLAQRSELVVMQASGFTRMQVALAVMKTAIPLVLLTNSTDELIKNHVPRLGAPIHMTITAEEVGAYKPQMKGFEYMLNKLNCGPDEILHVSSSLRYDLMTAYDLGIKNKVYVNRGHGPGNPAYEYTEISGIGGLPGVVGL